MQGPRVRLGELLVDSRIISREQLEEVLAFQKQDGRRLGTLLVEAGFVTETQVTQILSQQLSVPWVSLHHIDFSRQLLNLVPQDVAEKYCLVPIFVRRVPGLGETLYIAMDDPSDEVAQGEISQYSGLSVRAMIAPPSEIRAAIRVYYGGGTESASLSTTADPGTLDTGDSGRPSQPAGWSAQQARAGATKPPLPSVPAPEAIPSAPSSRDLSDEPPASGPRIEAREVSMPAPKGGHPRKMVTLTLLDGTRINLPARSPREPSQPAPIDSSELTARDLIAALRAVTHGADASEILGNEARWEPLFAALLSLLLKKQLIADWEFVDEFRRV